MSLPINIVTSGGLAVTESASGIGLAVTPVTSGGIAVTVVASGGLPVVGSGGSGIFNYNAAFLSNWRAAAAAVKTGTSDVFIEVGYGDSTTSGQGAVKQNRVPTKLAGLLIAAGFNASNEGLVSGGFPTAAIIDTTNLAIGAGWDFGSSLFVLGGRSFRASDFTSLLSYTPYNTVDTWDIGYVVVSTATSFSVAVDGGAPITTINATGGTAAIAVATVTVPSGTHRLDIQAVTGTPDILYLIGRVAAQKQLKLHNGGTVGATVDQFIVDGTNAYNPRPMLKTLAPALSIINLTINDWVQATSTSAYIADLTNLILDGQASGDVLLMSGAPSVASSAPIATQLIYINIVKALALSMNCTMLCVTDRWGSFLNKQSFYSDAAVHPNAAGYADIALGLSQILIPAANAPSVTATLDPSRHGTGTLSNGNLTWTSSGTNWQAAVNNVARRRGKYYREVTVGSATATDAIGLINPLASVSGGSGYPGTDFNGVGYFKDGRILISNALKATLATWGSGSLLREFADLDLNKYWVSVGSGGWNNDILANQNPAAGVGGIDISSVAPNGLLAACVAPDASGGNMTVNNGASAYAFTPPVGGGNWMT